MKLWGPKYVWGQVCSNSAMEPPGRPGKTYHHARNLSKMILLKIKFTMYQLL